MAKTRNGGKYKGKPQSSRVEDSSSGEEENILDSPVRAPASSDTLEREMEMISSDQNGEPSNQGCEVETEEDIDEEEKQPEPPASFYFRPHNYKKSCKIMTRCSISKVQSVLETSLGEYEMEWFTE